MADNHNPRSADRDVAFLGDDDPLAELMRIAGLEAQVEPVSREPADADPDEFDFDLEAELLRSFDVAETPATFVENADEPAADHIPATTSAEPAEVEELPAFLQRRPPVEDVVPEANLEPQVETPAPAAPFADDDDGGSEQGEALARAPQPLDEEWVDLPEWTRPSGQSRTDVFERVYVEVEPETTSVDEPAAEEPAIPDAGDAASIESEFIEPNPVMVAHPESELESGVKSELLPEPEHVLAVASPVAEEPSLENAIAFEDRSDVKVDDRGETDAALDSALNDFDFGAIELNEDPRQAAVEEAHPIPEAPISQPQPAEPMAVRATDWDIADDLERAFRELETGTLPGHPVTAAKPLDTTGPDFLPNTLEDAQDEAPEQDHFAEPVSSVEIQPEELASVSLAAPAVDQAAFETETVARPVQEMSVVEEAVLVERSDDLDLDFDFDDLELQLQEETQQALDPEPALEPWPEQSPAIAPAVAVAPVAAATQWHVPSSAAAVQHHEPSAVAHDDVAATDAKWVATDDPVDDIGSDLAFNIHEVASTDTFIEPVGEIDVPELPRDEDWQAVDRLDDLDLSGVEAEFADILSQGDMTAPPATTDPSRSAGASDPGVATTDKAPIQIDFADFDFASLSRPGFAGAAAAAMATAGTAQPSAAARSDRSPAIVEGFDDERGHYSQEEPSAERRKLFSLPFARRTTALALLGAFVVVGLGAYALSGGGELLSDEPRVIAADNEPIKVVPDDPGGRAVPNQDQAVYDQVDGRGPDGEAQLVSRAEEPVDIVQRTLDPEVLPLEGRPSGDDIGAVIGSAEEDESLSAQFSAEDESDGAMNVEARRVQTMVVRPDGTLVPRENTATATVPGDLLAGAGDPLSPTTLLTEAASATTEPETAVDALPQDLPGDEVASEEAAGAAAERLTPVAEPVAAPTDGALTAPVRTVETTALTGEGVPVPPSRPADQPVTIVGNASQPGAPAAAPAEVATAQPQAGLGENAGGYVVQIASQPTQESAQSTYQSLVSRFGSIIGGRGYQIQAADIPDRGTFYRVRVAGGTREEAVALCERYQAAGGSCFVAR